jgi:hypothetical protein
MNIAPASAYHVEDVGNRQVGIGEAAQSRFLPKFLS